MQHHLITVCALKSELKRSWQADLSDVPRTRVLAKCDWLTELMQGSEASRREKQLSIVFRRELTKTRSVEAECIEANKTTMF